MTTDSDNSSGKEGTKRGIPNAQPVQPHAGAEHKETSPPPGPSPEDQNRISNRSREIAEILMSLNRLPEIREARVLDIKQRIQRKTYIIDPRQVADAILKNL